MTTTIAYPSPESGYRIFFLCAFGSALLHAVLLACLAYFPTPPVVQEPAPTVHVKLIQAPQMAGPAQQPPTKPPTPATPDLPHPTPPSLLPKAMPSTPARPLQASVKPAPAKPLAPPPPLTSTLPILKDTQTPRVVKSRQMMKMAIPQPSDQRSPLSPAIPQRERLQARVPLHLNNQKPKVHHSLPPPQSPPALPALKAPTPLSAGSSVSRPMIVSSSKPLYPRVARESGWEGTVVVRTLITPDGIPSQLEIRKSCGHEALDLAAQEAIKTWKFQPAKDGNIPVAKWVDIPIKFDLNS